MGYFEDTMKGLGTFIFATIISAIFDFILAVPLMFSWNYVMPTIFNLGKIGYWQCWCLLFILTCLWKVNIVGYKTG